MIEQDGHDRPDLGLEAEPLTVYCTDLSLTRLREAGKRIGRDGNMDIFQGGVYAITGNETEGNLSSLAGGLERVGRKARAHLGTDSHDVIGLR